MKARDGDGKSRDQLFHILSERFRLFTAQKVGEKEDIEDIVQDTLVIIAKSFESKVIEYSFAGWVYKVLRSRIYDHYHKSRRRKKLQDSLSLGASDQENGKGKYVGLKSRLLKCLGRVHEVNKRHARILVLHYQGYQPEDICRKLGLSKNVYYITLHRARRLLEQCLTKEGSGSDEL